MPVLNPAELWQRTGRYEIDELFKLSDRSGAELVLAMTHEEVVTCHVAQRRALLPRPAADPLPLPDQGARRAAAARRRAAHARVHHEGRLHLRPRRGGARRALRAHIEAYDRIFDRAGCEWYRVESDVGMMGGIGAHEYMAPCAAGENDVALAPGYAANVEVASAEPQPVELPAPLRRARARSRTPGLTTVEQVARHARRAAPGALLKALPGGRRGPRARAGRRARRPPRQRDQARTTRSARRSARRAPRSSPSASARPATSGRSAPTSPILLDDAVGRGRLRHRRQPPDAHLRGVEPGPRLRRSSAPTCARVEAGDTRRRRARSGSSRRSRSATSSSSARATPSRWARPTSTSPGREQPIWMGSYGIGPARIAAAADRAGRRRARASPGRARSRPSTSTSSAGPRGLGGARAGRAPLRRAARDRPGRPLRRPRRRPGREVRRRRAARLPAAGDGRAAHGWPAARSRSRCGAGARTARCRWRAPRRRWRSCGGPPVGEGRARRAPPAEEPPSAPRLTFRRLPGLDRSGPPPPADARRPAAASVDDPERDRLPAPRR